MSASQPINLYEYNGTPVELIIVQDHHLLNEERIFRMNSVINVNDPHCTVAHCAVGNTEASLYSIIGQNNCYYSSSLGSCISKLQQKMQLCFEVKKINVSKVEYYTEINASDMCWNRYSYARYINGKRTYSYKGEQFTEEWFLWLNEILNKLQDRRKK